ncbi:MAG: type II toxin-antitoxin system VapC family toxin [Tannerellaceae bacterium]|jgi:PIN domain nuclease of toxin-antitoxin system|nr:type II toxin-antitoxin system VapC family toxin [Tannerellaceae bacterium]
MRYYLDTNILVFILTWDEENISPEVLAILNDYGSVLYVSSVAVKELILLYRIGKMKLKRFKSEADVLDDLKEAGIEIRHFNQHHFIQYTKLEITEGHKDMNDHAIISQAISDKIPLISSDRTFKDYVSQELNFVFNKR